ncbi:MAG: phage Gp37/Gp68 family protein [Oscillospiraceae bacterium]|jgi:protein gp37|nr:phage Gp37/Gp68 family protein [Oscillospiraceae bacterium]
MNVSKIEWTDRTWNPITGCTKLSIGCENCYAEIMAHRLKAMGVGKYINGFKPTMHDGILEEPIKWKKSHTVFVCSMADLFHKDIPFSFIDKIMSTIRKTEHHRYQILTKRADRMVEYFSNVYIPKNIWLGVTVESPSEITRIEYLRDIQATIRFISCEPLIEDLGNIDLTDIDWIIVGGESGAKARPMKPEWVRTIKQQADEQNVAFFFKQWGTWGSDGIKRNKKANGKTLDGQTIQKMPKLAIG